MSESIVSTADAAQPADKTSRFNISKWALEHAALTRYLLVVLMLSTILTFADFQVPFVLTNGSPFNSTHVLATWAYQWGVPGGEIGLGAAVSVVLFPLLSVLVAGTLLLIRRPE